MREDRAFANLALDVALSISPRLESDQITFVKGTYIPVVMFLLHHFYSRFDVQHRRSTDTREKVPRSLSILKISKWPPMTLPITSAVPGNRSRQRQFPGIDHVSCSRELITSAVPGNRSRQLFLGTIMSAVPGNRSWQAFYHGIACFFVVD